MMFKSISTHNLIVSEGLTKRNIGVIYLPLVSFSKGVETRIFEEKDLEF